MLVKENPYIPKEDRDFFILLRIGLWQKACPEHVEGVEEKLSLCPDWNYICTLACEQTVQGIVADGIGLYRKEHPDLNITQEQNDRFLSASAQIVRQNFKVNQVQIKICKLFDEQNVDYVILKGQVVGKCYPKPNLRCSGDIDFFMPEAEYEKAKNILEQTYGCEAKEYTHGHYETEVEGICVELHGPEKLNFGKRIEQVMLREFDNGYKTPTYHLLYLFMHCLQHFFVTGLGIRQICDWVMFLHSNKEADNKILQSALQDMKLQHAWDIFMQFAVDWLGLNSPLAFRRGAGGEASLWSFIKDTGNMGHHKDKIDEPNLFVRVLHRFITYCKYSQKRRQLSPEIDRFMWKRRTKENFNNLKRKLCNSPASTI